jgi:hypothetical protein
MWRNEKPSTTEILTTTELYALLELGSFLAHAHDFCNLISFALVKKKILKENSS